MSTTDEATVTSKGQITIPKRVRERMGLETGEKVSFIVKENGVAMVRKTGDPMDQLREVQERLAPLSVDVDELMAESKREWSKHE